MYKNASAYLNDRAMPDIACFEVKRSSLGWHKMMQRTLLEAAILNLYLIKFDHNVKY